jgi:transposase
MMQAVTVGLDIAKNVFHAYGVGAQGLTVFSRKLRRAQVEVFFSKLEPCLIGIEACATAHHWARTFAAMGHEVRLMPPAYVKPYVKTQKNDEADAEAICEAVTRPNMRFADIKSVDQQSVLVLHRTRTMLIKHRTRMGNTIRAHLAEFGITEAIGREGLARLIDLIVTGEDTRITVQHALYGGADFYAACAAGSRYTSPRVINTQAIRAILFAIATAARLEGAQDKSCSNGRSL